MAFHSIPSAAVADFAGAGQAAPPVSPGRPPLPLCYPAAALLACLGAGPAWAQAAAVAQFEEVNVTDKAAPVLDADSAAVGGFAAPLAEVPQSISVLGADLLSATATQSVSQALRLDAALSDSYNTTGYPDSISVRGFTLQALGNYQRNGMGIQGFAPQALENKQDIEVLKGVAGLQAGVAAPGGLVNYVTKRPAAHDFNALALQADQRGGSKLHWDASRHWGTVGLRVNAAAEQLHSHFKDADGQRRFISLAVDAPLTPDTRLSADFEYHRKSQPSVPALGLLDLDGDGRGESLPSVIPVRLNLNSQPWSLPYQTWSQQAEVRLEQRLAGGWQARLGLNHSRTRFNDRVAFPDGCSGAATYVYPGLCADGGVDIYDFRDDGVRRALSGWQAEFEGETHWAGAAHRLRLGVSGYQSRERHADFQAYNWVGTSNIHAPVELPADGTLTVRNTNSDQHATEAFASVQSRWNAVWTSYAGLRVTRLSRSSAQSDGSDAVDYRQTVTTPWLGLSAQPAAGWTVYASWGQGVELDAAPRTLQAGGRLLYRNAGQVLPALRSRQTELGLKWQARPRLLLSAAVFQIERPTAGERTLPGDNQPSYVAGARKARHRGLELNAAGQLGTQWSLQASAAWLDARYTRAADEPDLQGQRVTNVPRFAASVFADYKVAAAPGLSLNALAWLQDGKRATADGRAVLPRAWQLDAGLRYEHVMGRQLWQWSLQAENLTDRVYWREVPTTAWGGTYLFPSAPRTVRASLRVEW
ncbi:TonB-dependent siderophore receptor [Corticibacter populi]|nr:TonB-dependent siderophore receptor [Corticibacter populi]RZS32973.1 iron complex outermembrane receptor protein [Corticibacter populi]